MDLKGSSARMPGAEQDCHDPGRAYACDGLSQTSRAGAQDDRDSRRRRIRLVFRVHSGVVRSALRVRADSAPQRTAVRTNIRQTLRLEQRDRGVAQRVGKRLPVRGARGVALRPPGRPRSSRGPGGSLARVERDRGAVAPGKRRATGRAGRARLDSRTIRATRFPAPRSGWLADPSSGIITCAAACGKTWAGWRGSSRDARSGVTLGGGGARGFAHIGVIRALEEARIPIDMICGSAWAQSSPASMRWDGTGQP